MFATQVKCEASSEVNNKEKRYTKGPLTDMTLTATDDILEKLSNNLFSLLKLYF
jgi:hypothetical protein